MGILDRLNRLVRSNVSDISGSGSAEHTRRELESSLREARRQQAELRRDEKQIIESIREARAEAEKWEDRAMLALQHDDEQLAREALKAKNKAVRRADNLRDELEEHRNYMEDIGAALSALKQKLDAYRDRTSLPSEDSEDRAADWDRRLKRRHGSDSGPERRSESSGSSGHFDTGDTFSEFDRMAGKINEFEAGVEAMRELNEGIDGGSSELENKFRELESRSPRSTSDSSENRERSQKSDDARDRSPSDDADEPDHDAERDDLSDKKRRMDRLSELKDRFDDE